MCGSTIERLYPAPVGCHRRKRSGAGPQVGVPQPIALIVHLAEPVTRTSPAHANLGRNFAVGGKGDVIRPTNRDLGNLSMQSGHIDIARAANPDRAQTAARLRDRPLP